MRWDPLTEWNTERLLAADEKFVCITSEQLTAAIGAIHDSILEVCSQ
jgi:hypothetical protein